MTDAQGRDVQAASCRVAFAAFLHDLGKLVQRAQLFDADPRREANQQLYCPHRRAHERDPGFFTHLHAADTALALDALQPHLPELLGADPFPFAPPGSADPTNSLVNAAAAHHKPETFLQWVIASADRIASGFEREGWEKYNASQERPDFRTARLLVRFEEARRDRQEERALRFRYPLKLLSAAALMPELKATLAKGEAVQQYRALWDGLMPGEDGNRGVGLIPKSHRACWTLWLDHFDTLWLTVAHAIPSATAFGTRPDVSLYDHSKTTAALAVALWRYHHERGDDQKEVAARLEARSDWEEAKFLLVQGDFSGIQNFVFGGAAQTQKRAARLLRGRSALVSLLTELAAIRLLDELALPATSQIINAAGRFLIVAPNTEGVRAAVKRVREELDCWFVSNLFGLTGIAVAATEASAADFTEGEGGDWRFSAVLDRLRSALEVEKRRLFARVADGVLEADFVEGPCRFDGRLPAAAGCEVDGEPAHPLSADAVALGKALADPNKARLLIFRAEAAEDVHGLLTSDFFGYRVLVTGDQEASGNFGDFARDGRLRRAFDISLPPAEPAHVAWNGYARRALSAYVALHQHQPDADHRYAGLDPAERGEIKTFEHLARDDRCIEEDGRIIGVEALGVLKGDIDDLGALFADTMGAKPTFAKWAELSRRVNAFFTHWVPYRLAADRSFRNIYTVFAGGDDFVFIGPWRTTRKFAAVLRDDFRRYVAENDRVHFSAGYAMVKPGHPVRQMLHEAEEALERAKAREAASGRKNAFALYGTVIPWPDWGHAVEAPILALEKHLASDDLSSGYLYGLLQITEMARAVDQRPENARWRSRLFYQTRRFTERMRGLEKDKREPRALELIQLFGEEGIEQNADGFRVALFDQLYARRQ